MVESGCPLTSALLMWGGIPHHHLGQQENMARRLNTKWNIQRRPNFTNKCILIASIFANKSQTITKRLATSNFHSLLQSFCIKITRFDFLFFQLHFPLLLPLYFINLSLGTMDNIWYSSITLTAALKMSLQHHHISHRAGILPPLHQPEPHLCISPLPSSPFSTRAESPSTPPPTHFFCDNEKSMWSNLFFKKGDLFFLKKWCNLMIGI